MDMDGLFLDHNATTTLAMAPPNIYGQYAEPEPNPVNYEYAIFHLIFTIPTAILLTIFNYPLMSRLDYARITFLVTIAVTATTPWDSYLIRAGIWSYPPEVVIGYTICDIPIEEVFFFFIQTYITSQIYIFMNRGVLHASRLYSNESLPPAIRRLRTSGISALATATMLGVYMTLHGGEGTYLGGILVWVCPFALVTWSLSGHFILALPWTSTVVPVVLPTVWLWVADEMALRRGTWSIGSSTKLGLRVFGELEVEEAVFFFATNVLIVFGLACFDNAVAVVDAFPSLVSEPSEALSLSLIAGLIYKADWYDMFRIEGIRQGIARLERKSRSFHLASSVFPGRLRIDLTLLYSWCRLADDLVDEAKSESEARAWISLLREHVNAQYAELSESFTLGKTIPSNLVAERFPESARATLQLLPVQILPQGPLLHILDGFETDLKFGQGQQRTPIRTEKDLEDYAAAVASTVGQLCMELVFYHCDPTGTLLDDDARDNLRAAARRMGLALQYINIVRDVAVDAKIGRVYLPDEWVREMGLTIEKILENPNGMVNNKIRSRVLTLAFTHYHASRDAMKLIPKEARGPMIVAVESYVEIGRAMVRKTGEKGTGAHAEVIEVKDYMAAGRATVPKSRRLWVAWKTLWQES